MLCNTLRLYQALGWLLQRQTRIENKLAKKHLSAGTLLLYDVSSSYYTGRQSSLVDHGYNRDGKRGVAQIVYGLLCNGQGCPIAIEVFAGNTSDPQTFSSQVEKVRKRFGLQRVVFVGDRGMITGKRIDEDLRETEGLDWITSLKSTQIRAYKSLAKVERAFRSLKTMDLKIRPIYHRLDDRIRSHVFLCTLAYYVEWHMRQRLSPLLFDDEEKEAAQADRESIVSPAVRSETAQQKDATKRTPEGYLVQSF